MADKETQLFLSASSSPSNFGATVYAEVFRRHGVNAVYLPRKTTDATSLVAAIRALDVRGCSVSMPLKSAVVPLLDDVDDEAKRVQSVNTIVNDNGKLRGFNTDAHGFRAALRATVSSTLTSVVVYGAGSVVATVVDVLRGLGVASIALAGRNADKLRVAGDRLRATTWSGGHASLLVNATPASLSSPLDEKLVALASSSDAVFDLVVPTKGNHLHSFCAEKHITYVPGFAMYKHQCAKQIAHYTGINVEPDEIESIARDAGLIA